MSEPMTHEELQVIRDSASAVAEEFIGKSAAPNEKYCTAAARIFSTVTVPALLAELERLQTLLDDLYHECDTDTVSDETLRAVRAVLAESEASE